MIGPYAFLHNTKVYIDGDDMKLGSRVVLPIACTNPSHLSVSKYTAVEI